MVDVPASHVSFRVFSHLGSLPKKIYIYIYLGFPSVKCVPFHPKKNLPKGRIFTYLEEDPGCILCIYIYIINN